ncbi:hypothetical protein RP20_CCG023697 [Aedes albopictus]|nr:hypothetical protein RP20_CCG023697 [Aedes albopictus]
MHEEPQIKCPKCEKAFHFKSRLLEHLRTHQREIKLTVHREPELKCSKCEKTFHFKSRLLEHMRVHGESLTKDVVSIA